MRKKPINLIVKKKPINSWTDVDCYLRDLNAVKQTRAEHEAKLNTELHDVRNRYDDELNAYTAEINFIEARIVDWCERDNHLDRHGGKHQSLHGLISRRQTPEKLDAPPNLVERLLKAERNDLLNCTYRPIVAMLKKLSATEQAKFKIKIRLRGRD